MTFLETQLTQLLKYRLLPDKTYLAGGTAVYFYLNHRISIDLDFFTPTPFNPELLVHKIRTCVDPVQVELIEEKTVIVYISKEKVKFSLFLFPYKNLAENHPFTLHDGTPCPLASLQDIVAMKAVAITQRGSIKDFFDLYLLINKTGYHFEDILNGVISKYNVTNAYAYQLKTALVYFEDAEKELDNIIMIKENKRNTHLSGKQWQGIKAFFQEFIQ